MILHVPLADCQKAQSQKSTKAQRVGQMGNVVKLRPGGSLKFELKYILVDQAIF